MILRRETSADLEAIRAVHDAAFGHNEAGEVTEARLVGALREDGELLHRLSLVAEHDGQVIGHVTCSRGDIDGWPAVGLGPLGVAPAHQVRGDGRAPMHGTLAAADAMDEPCVVVLDDPAYYSRFGFEPAARFGVRPPDPSWVDHFQLRRLAMWDDERRGTFHYAAAFQQV